MNNPRHICEYCSIEFEGWRNHGKKFCSVDCHRKYLRICPRKHSDETKEKIGKAFRGIKIKEETKVKIKLNNAKYWLGKKRSKETNEKISNNLKGRFTQEKSHTWKGDKVGYKNAHVRVYRNRGMANHCEVCRKESPSGKYYWANLTGNYVDIYDYKQMCASCHKKYDLGRAKSKLL